MLDVVSSAAASAKGTIKNEAQARDVFRRTAASDKVLGMLNVANLSAAIVRQQRRRSVRRAVEKDTIEMELSSGQTTKVPLSQIFVLAGEEREQSDDPTATPENRGSLSVAAIASSSRFSRSRSTWRSDMPAKRQPQSIATIAYASEDIGVIRFPHGWIAFAVGERRSFNSSSPRGWWSGRGSQRRGRDADFHQGRTRSEESRREALSTMICWWRAGGD